jgi:SAM-dependent methyltransferase
MDAAYQVRIEAEKRRFQDNVNIHDLPPIFHYWSNAYLAPLMLECGFSQPLEFFAQHLAQAARRCAPARPEFVSIGAGNCDTELAVAALLREAGLDDFTLECLELNPAMLERGARDADAAGLARHLTFTEADFNTWQPTHRYQAVMANHSLHHVLNLEGLFDAIRVALDPHGYFVISDMIGRNGHQRWPEALAAVHRFWAELPPEYRNNRLLQRYEEMYENWDCSTEDFEGIRAQDIMPLLLERFEFDLFVGFSNVVAVFVDRAFGHNFDPGRAWDRDFIDRVQAFDEAGIRDGTLTPCQMFAVCTTAEPERRLYARNVPPASGVHPSLRRGSSAS